MQKKKKRFRLWWIILSVFGIAACAALGLALAPLLGHWPRISSERRAQIQAFLAERPGGHDGKRYLRLDHEDGHGGRDPGDAGVDEGTLHPTTEGAAGEQRQAIERGHSGHGTLAERGERGALAPCCCTS